MTFERIAIVILFVACCILSIFLITNSKDHAYERQVLKNAIDTAFAEVDKEVERRMILTNAHRELLKDYEELSNRPPEIKTKYVEIRTDYTNLTELGKDSAFAARISQADSTE